MWCLEGLKRALVQRFKAYRSLSELIIMIMKINTIYQYFELYNRKCKFLFSSLTELPPPVECVVQTSAVCAGVYAQELRQGLSKRKLWPMMMWVERLEL